MALQPFHGWKLRRKNYELSRYLGALPKDVRNCLEDAFERLRLRKIDGINVMSRAAHFCAFVCQHTIYYDIDTNRKLLILQAIVPGDDGLDP